MNAIRLCSLLLLLTTAAPVGAQQRLSCKLMRWQCDMYGNLVEPFVSGIPAGSATNALYFSGNSMTSIAHPELFDGIEYIIYMGNDWDYHSDSVPESWLKLKHLKGILLGNMDHVETALQKIRQTRTDLILDEYGAVHMAFADSSQTHTFQSSIRIPYSDKLESIAWKTSRTREDSIYIFLFFATPVRHYCFNEYWKEYPNPYIFNKKRFHDSAEKWLHASALLQNPPPWLIDSFICQHIRCLRLSIYQLCRLSAKRYVSDLNYCTQRMIQNYVYTMENGEIMASDLKNSNAWFYARLLPFATHHQLTDNTIRLLNEATGYR